MSRNKKLLSILLFLFLLAATALSSAWGGMRLYRHYINKKNQEYTLSTMGVKINDGDFRCSYPLIEDGKQYYIALLPLSMALGYEWLYDPSAGTIVFGKDTLTLAEHPEIITYQNQFYIGLKDLDKWETFSVHDSDLSASDRQFIYIDTFGEPFDYSWTECPMICHGLGTVDGKTQTNSLEAFNTSYDAGIRVFEADFSLTSDGTLVAIHDWEAKTLKKYFDLSVSPAADEEESDPEYPLTAEDFLSRKIYGSYTTLSFRDIAELMASHPDMYLVTDSKATEDPLVTREFQQMYEIAQEVDPSILDRIIPQIYNEKMYDSIMNIYKWKSMIYTLYQLKYDFSEFSAIRFAYEHGIRVITVNRRKARDLFFHELFERDIMVYMHTYNKVDAFRQLKQLGVHGIYTDKLLPSDLEEY